MKRQSLLGRLAAVIVALIISWTLAQAPLAAAADEFPHGGSTPTPTVQH